MFFEIIASFAIFLRSVDGYHQLRECSWPYNLQTPFPYRTLSPINIDSSETSLANVPTPLRLTVGQFEPHVVKNNGFSVTATANQSVITSVTGGVLGSDIYIFQELLYLWNGDYRSTSGPLIDGVGGPLHIRATFRNTKYPNAAVASHKRDGYAVLSFVVNVEGHIPNQLFKPFANILQTITRSGSSAIATSLPLFVWFDQLASFEHYFAYPGSYILFNGGDEIHTDSTTVIQFPRCLQFSISISDFQYFLNLTNPSGTPITYSLASHQRLDRPVVEVQGVQQVIVPTAA